MSKAWLSLYGGFVADVTPEGGLVLSHPHEDEILRDVDCGRHALSDWIEVGVHATTLACVSPRPDLKVPRKAVVAMLVLWVPLGV
jgi:hypothetical protein